MKSENQRIRKSKLSDLRKIHGATNLSNLKTIQGGQARALLQGVCPPDDPFCRGIIK